MIAADLIKTGCFGDSSANRNLDSFIPAVPGRRRRFCRPLLPKMVPRFSAASVAYGVSFCPDTKLAGHEGWRLERGAARLEVGQVLAATAFRDSSFHLLSYKVNAFGAQMAGTRRITCAGFTMRAFFQFFSQITRPCSMPQTDQLGEEAPGTITTPRARSDSESAPAKKSL